MLSVFIRLSREPSPEISTRYALALPAKCHQPLYKVPHDRSILWISKARSDLACPTREIIAKFISRQTTSLQSPSRHGGQGYPEMHAKRARSFIDHAEIMRSTHEALNAKRETRSRNTPKRSFITPSNHFKQQRKTGFVDLSWRFATTREINAKRFGLFGNASR